MNGDRTDKRRQERDAQRKSSLLQRLGTRLARGATKILHGYDVAFLDDMVSTLGLAGMREWGERLEQVSARAEQELGPVRGQHAIAFVALLTGCPFCSVSHLYAGNLVLFAETGAVFPIDERDVRRIQRLQDPDLLRQMADDLAAYPETLAMFHRLYALKFNRATGVESEDDVLRAVISLWDVVVECTILQDDLEPAEIDPIHPLAKDAELRRRYREAREHR